jgi:DNA-binding Lrp family transcriptional regulator
MSENKNNIKESDVVLKDLSEDLTEKDIITIISLMRNGRLKDEELMGILGAKNPNSAAYYRKKLEEKGIIKRYTAEINWSKIGYKTEFLILAEGSDTRSFDDIERDYIFGLVEYLDKIGDIIITPAGLGKVILSGTYNCFGEKSMVLIHGYATSDQDAITYSRGYLTSRYPGIKTTIVTVKYSSVLNSFIQKEIVNVIKDSFTMTKEDKAALEHFKKTFPWDKLGAKK